MKHSVGWSSSKLGYSWTRSECCRRTLNRKEQLRHRAVSLQQHGFLVFVSQSRVGRRLHRAVHGECLEGKCALWWTPTNIASSFHSSRRSWKERHLATIWRALRRTTLWRSESDTWDEEMIDVDDVSDLLCSATTKLSVYLSQSFEIELSSMCHLLSKL